MLAKMPIRIEKIAAGMLLSCFIAGGLCALTASSAVDNAAAARTLVNRIHKSDRLLQSTLRNTLNTSSPPRPSGRRLDAIGPSAPSPIPPGHTSSIGAWLEPACRDHLAVKQIDVTQPAVVFSFKPCGGPSVLQTLYMRRKIISGSAAQW